MQTIQLDGREWVKVAEAAEHAGVEPVTIYKNIERGRLSKREVLGVIAVPLDEVEALWPAKPEPVQ